MRTFESSIYNCNRCGGTGTIDVFKHVEDGVCFRCGGTGREPDRAPVQRPVNTVLPEYRRGTNKQWQLLRRLTPDTAELHRLVLAAGAPEVRRSCVSKHMLSTAIKMAIANNGEVSNNVVAFRR